MTATTLPTPAVSTADRDAHRRPGALQLIGRAMRSEFVRLGRPKVLGLAAGVTAAYAVLATYFAVAAVEPRGRPGALTTADLAGAGGGTAAIRWVSGTAAVLVLAVFIANVAGDFARGTFRASALEQPRRLPLLLGKVAALVALVAVLMAVALVIGWVTSTVVAPGQGLSTAGWWSADAFGRAAADYGLVMAYALGWAVIGVTIASLTRSVPIGLAVGLVWAGPIENVIGEAWSPGPRWFPGLLLRTITGSGEGSVTVTRAAVTLAVYGVVALAVVGWAMSRRDVTS